MSANSNANNAYHHSPVQHLRGRIVPGETFLKLLDAYPNEAYKLKNLFFDMEAELDALEKKDTVSRELIRQRRYRLHLLREYVKLTDAIIHAQHCEAAYLREQAANAQQQRNTPHRVYDRETYRASTVINAFNDFNL